MWRFGSLAHEKPTVLARRMLFHVASEDLHQRFGEEHAPLRSVLWCTDLHAAAVLPLDLTTD